MDVEFCKNYKFYDYVFTYNTQFYTIIISFYTHVCVRMGCMECNDVYTWYWFGIQWDQYMFNDVTFFLSFLKNYTECMESLEINWPLSHLKLFRKLTKPSVRSKILNSFNTYMIIRFFNFTLEYFIIRLNTTYKVFKKQYATLEMKK